MAFIMKKKRYKFMVDLCLDELSEVSYSKAILFAKVRQLEGGNFTDVSKRMEVQNHRVQYNARFQFPCKMNANASSGVLESCKCRLSIRMEEKGGKNFRKLGFTDVNLAEYAGAGPSTQRYILQPYDLNHRLDNSIVQITLNITLKEGDTIFQRPLTRTQPILLPGEEEKKRNNSLPNPAIKRNNLTIPDSDLVMPKVDSSGSIPVGGAEGGAVGGCGTTTGPPSSIPANVVNEEDPSHTRNSSTTSQASAGYSSQNSQPPGQHSRQSSSGGESSHGRMLEEPPRPTARSKSKLGYSLSMRVRNHGSCNIDGDGCQSDNLLQPPIRHRRTRSEYFDKRQQYHRNLSQGSSDTGFFGSMEKEKRRKKLDEGRIDAEMVINELMEGVELDKAGQEEAETSGLELFVAPDGSVSFDKRSSRKNYERVVIGERR